MTLFEDALGDGKQVRLMALPNLEAKGKHTLAPEELRILEKEAAAKALEHMLFLPLADCSFAHPHDL